MGSITFRSDETIEVALADLAEGTDRSQAIRDAILAAYQRKRDERLREQALAVSTDEADVAEARSVLRDMESLRAW